MEEMLYHGMKDLNSDVWYVDNISFLLDMKILVMTIFKVIKRDGINEQGQASMSKFTGNE